MIEDQAEQPGCRISKPDESFRARIYFLKADRGGPKDRFKRLAIRIEFNPSVNNQLKMGPDFGDRGSCRCRCKIRWKTRATSQELRSPA